ncbi:MAG: FHA domain-containing protein [Miltoncostaeaceae bacterium]
MTETGLLVAQVAFLVLLFGFLAAIVRSSARQLGRVQPPPMAPGPVVDPPRRPEAPPAPVAPGPPERPPVDAADEGTQSTLEPFPSPLAGSGAPDAPSAPPGGVPDAVPPVMAAQLPAAPDPVPDVSGMDTAAGVDEPAPAEPRTAAEEPTPFDLLQSSTQVGSASMMDLTSGITPRLIVESSPNLEVGSDLELEGGLTVGRSGAADLSISDQYVSHMHARIMRRGPYWFVEDLGSTNGTFLNDRRVESSAQLKVHDSLRMGQTTLRYEE